MLPWVSMSLSLLTSLSTSVSGYRDPRPLVTAHSWYLALSPPCSQPWPLCLVPRRRGWGWGGVCVGVVSRSVPGPGEEATEARKCQYIIDTGSRALNGQQQ